MKTILFLTVLISQNAFALGGTEGGDAGGNGKEVKKKAIAEFDAVILESGKKCLMDLNPKYSFDAKSDLSLDFLKKEIEKELTKPKTSVGRAIASVDEDYRSFDCNLFAKYSGDEKFVDTVLPKEKIAPVDTIKESNQSIPR